MSFNPLQFKDLIERTLKGLRLYSPSAVALLLGTSAQESQFGTYLRQLGNGPALGVYQCEPDAEKDVWHNCMAYRTDLRARVYRLTGATGPNPDRMEYDLVYATVICRIDYYREPEPLPKPYDMTGLARYWKKYWNTAAGDGTVEQFIKNYKKYLEGIWI